jgi:hypothetical protein
MCHYILECMMIMKILQNCFQVISFEVQMVIKMLMQFIQGEIPF